MALPAWQPSLTGPPHPSLSQSRRATNTAYTLGWLSVPHRRMAVLIYDSSFASQYVCMHVLSEVCKYQYLKGERHDCCSYCSTETGLREVEWRHRASRLLENTKKNSRTKNSVHFCGNKMLCEVKSRKYSFFFLNKRKSYLFLMKENTLL